MQQPYNKKQPKPFSKNWEIPGNTITLVETPQGAKNLPKKEAIQKATEQGLELVLISYSQDKPPICKIGDAGKLRYQFEKSHTKQKPKPEKEIWLHSGTAPHDLQTKLKHAERFLQQGNPITFKIQYRGREKAHKELGVQLLNHVAKSLEDFGKFKPVIVNGAHAILKAGPKPQKNLKNPNKDEPTQI